MTTKSAVVMALFGGAFWIGGTVLYRIRGAGIFETTSLRYWLNFVITPTATTLLCVGIFRWMGVPSAEWASAALLIALPGMIVEAMLLSNFAKWMPKMQATSAGSKRGVLAVFTKAESAV